MAYKLTDDQNYIDIADAIRGKTGSSDTFLPSEMASAIENIPTGGSSEVKTIFIDYDGTILYEYTQAEVDAMTELPELPTHDGLVAEEWNWTLEEIQELGRPVVVGVNYITDDGRTRIYITVPEGEKKIYLAFALTSSFSGKVYWGDGTNDDISTNNRKKEHTYEESGDYVVEVDITTGAAGMIASNREGTHLIWGNLDRAGGASGYVNKIELGNNLITTAYGFKKMPNLQTITIPSYITLADYLFEDDYCLKCIVVPRGITKINSSLMNDCKKLERVSIPNSIEEVDTYAFNNCTCLRRITLSDNIENIRESAFYECGYLEELFINSNIIAIGRSAFYKCTGLNSIVFSSALISIGTDAFEGSDIEEVVINGEVNINSSIFSTCMKLKKATIGGTEISLEGNMLERCPNLEEVIFTDGVPDVPSYTFQHCNSLRKITLPDTVTSIGNYAFFNCWRLEEIELPDALETIGTYAFSACESVGKLIIPESVVAIRSYAFQAMYSLRELIFLGDIQSVEGSAFYEDYHIKVIDFTNCTSVPSLSGASYFPKPEDEVIEIRVPASLYDTWIAASGWSSIKNYIVAV